VPDHRTKVEREVRSQKIVEKKMVFHLKKMKRETSNLKKKGGNPPKQKPPKTTVETLVRLLWRAAGSGAKALPLAARPITICPLDVIQFVT